MERAEAQAEIDLIRQQGHQSVEARSVRWTLWVLAKLSLRLTRISIYRLEGDCTSPSQSHHHPCPRIAKHRFSYDEVRTGPQMRTSRHHDCFWSKTSVKGHRVPGDSRTKLAHLDVTTISYLLLPFDPASWVSSNRSAPAYGLSLRSNSQSFSVS